MDSSMRKIWIRYGIFAAVFIVAMVFFSIYLNQGTTDMTVEMKEATLPLAEVIINEQKINEMHGYTRKMDVSTIRDSITPIGEDRALTFAVEKFDQDISAVSFEVRSSDGERLIENTQVFNYEEDHKTIKATVNIKDLIEENTEYNFVLILQCADGNDVYYYTRIIQNEEAKTAEKIAYVLDFHNKTFNKDAAKELSVYLEPNSEGDDTTFQRVTIHSSLNQVAWGDMRVREVGEPSITICEIGNQTASICLDYIVNIVDGKVSNHYKIKEFYRIRYTTERFYLLAYDRTMNEIFTMGKESFANNKIVLGVQNNDSQMMESDGGNILAFANEGRVYSYNVTENKLARLFAFFVEDDYDKRTIYGQSNVKILNVEENGNVLFMIYGYMNRGTHEGEVGVEICYYNSVLNMIEEQIFLSYDKSPQILNADIEKLAYVNMSGDFYVFMDGDIYRVDISNQTYKRIVAGLNEETFYVSNTNKMVVWQEENDPNVSRSLVLMNLNSEETTKIESKNSEYIKPIGFMNEDLIYGIANESDLIRNRLGDTIFPMKRVVIQSESGEVLKDYQMENIYVTGGKIEANQITLTRIKKGEEDENFTEIEDDQITNNVMTETGSNHIVTAVTNLHETIFQIELKKEVDTKTLKFLTPKEVLYEGGRNVELKQEEKSERFFVYAQGNIQKIYVNPAAAVKFAYDNMGTVVDNWGNEIYRRGELSTRNQIMAIKEESVTEEKNSLAVCLDTILKYQGISRNTEYMLERNESVHQILEDNIRNADILNLTGCSVDTILYYVNKDIPVLAYLNDGKAVLIIGFNEQNTVLMDPETGTIYKKGMNDSRTFFEENGNRFITYIIKENLEND